MSVPAKRDISIGLSPTGQVLLAGLPLFVGCDSDLLDTLDSLISREAPSLVVTANVDQCIDLSSSPGLWAAYKAASLRTLDGMPLVWLAKTLGAKGVVRQTGADMLYKCVEASSKRGWRIVILGGEPSANDRAVANLRRDFAAADIQGMQLPFSSDFQTPEVKAAVAVLAALRPDVVFLCLGSPKQENFFMQLQQELPPAAYVGAGAAVDFASGDKRRAPIVIQKLGLEWTWRLVQEPRRLGRRYLVKGTGLGRIIYNTMGKK